MQMMMKFRLGADAETGAGTDAAGKDEDAETDAQCAPLQCVVNVLSEKRGRRGIAVGRAVQGAFLGPYIDGQ